MPLIGSPAGAAHSPRSATYREARMPDIVRDLAGPERRRCQHRSAFVLHPLQRDGSPTGRTAGRRSGHPHARITDRSTAASSTSGLCMAGCKMQGVGAAGRTPEAVPTDRRTADAHERRVSLDHLVSAIPAVDQVQAPQPVVALDPGDLGAVPRRGEGADGVGQCRGSRRRAHVPARV